MHVAIIGSGPIAQGAAALLSERGHTATLWSPRGSLGQGGPMTITTAGLAQITTDVAVAAGPEAVADADVVMFALRGNGHRAAMDAVAPHLRADQSVIISSQASLGGLYLARLLAARGIRPLIACWATTVTGGPMADGKVRIGMLRNMLEVATIPADRADEGVALSAALFGDRFGVCPNLFAISLSNLNPPFHMANALLNFTRIENAEDWSNYGGITAAVGQLVEELDAERLALADRMGVTVRTALEHYRKSHDDLPDTDSVHELAQAIAARRKGTSPGPRDVSTRFITEDVPFGIAFIVALGKLAGVPTPVHSAGLILCNAIYGRDFVAENDLLAGLDLENDSLDSLSEQVLNGFGAEDATSSQILDAHL